MDLKKFISVLTDEDQDVLRKLLDTNYQQKINEQKAKQKATQDEWEKGEKPKLIAKIDAVSKEVTSLKNQQIDLDLKLTLFLKTTVDAHDIKENLKAGHSSDFDYEVTGKATALDGKRSKLVTFINAHLNTFLNDACDDVLVLFPEYVKDANKLANKYNEVRAEVRKYSIQNLNL